MPLSQFLSEPREWKYYSGFHGISSRVPEPLVSQLSYKELQFCGEAYKIRFWSGDGRRGRSEM